MDYTGNDDNIDKGLFGINNDIRNDVLILPKWKTKCGKFVALTSSDDPWFKEGFIPQKNIAIKNINPSSKTFNYNFIIYILLIIILIQLYMVFKK